MGESGRSEVVARLGREASRGGTGEGKASKPKIGEEPKLGSSYSNLILKLILKHPPSTHATATLIKE